MESTISEDTIDLLRRFHFGEPAAAERTEKPESAILPALLNAYRDASAIRYQYPLYLAPPGGAAGEKLAKPVSEHFSEALQAIDADAPDRSLLASAAKAKLSAVAARATNEGIQMHGGIGMTDEYDIGLFIKRARVLQHWLGDENFHLDRMARLSGY